MTENHPLEAELLTLNVYYDIEKMCIITILSHMGKTSKKSLYDIR